MNICDSQSPMERLRASALGRLAEGAALAAQAGCMTAKDLRSISRSAAPIALARQHAMYLAHVALGLTLTSVGLSFGRDRTTVRHACFLIEDQRSSDCTDLAMAALESGLVAQAAALDLGTREQDYLSGEWPV
jgi:Bacterial dnaA protein helix-turn-helix